MRPVCLPGHGLPQVATGSRGSLGWRVAACGLVPSVEEKGVAICQDCEQEMLEASSCTVDALILDGRRFARDRARGQLGVAGRCPDCGVGDRGYHHLGCDLEDCPRCRRQLLSCGCSWLDEDTESLVAVAGTTVVYPEALRGMRVAKDPERPWG
jgi:hypothetical protein